MGEARSWHIGIGWRHRIQHRFKVQYFKDPKRFIYRYYLFSWIQTEIQGSGMGNGFHPCTKSRDQKDGCLKAVAHIACLLANFYFCNHTSSRTSLLVSSSSRIFWALNRVCHPKEQGIKWSSMEHITKFLHPKKRCPPVKVTINQRFYCWSIFNTS